LLLYLDDGKGHGVWGKRLGKPATAYSHLGVNIDFSGRVAAILDPQCRAGEQRDASQFAYFPSAAKDSDLRPSYSGGRLTGWG
jgi:hypothetical protein